MNVQPSNDPGHGLNDKQLTALKRSIKKELGQGERFKSFQESTRENLWAVLTCGTTKEAKEMVNLVLRNLAERPAQSSLKAVRSLIVPLIEKRRRKNADSTQVVLEPLADFCLLFSSKFTNPHIKTEYMKLSGLLGENGFPLERRTHVDCPECEAPVEVHLGGSAKCGGCKKEWRFSGTSSRGPGKRWGQGPKLRDEIGLDIQKLRATRGEEYLAIEEAWRRSKSRDPR